MGEESQDTTQFMSRVNDDYNVIRIRLDPSDVYERIETYLKGCKIQEYETGEGIKREIIRFSKPKMNDEGIGSLLNWIAGTINAQLVQGNFYVDKHGYSSMYQEYIYEYNLALLKMIIINAPKWAIDDEDLTPVVDHIMLMIQPFMSRLIGNKERESYSTSLQSNERHTVASKSQLNLFKK